MIDADRFLVQSTDYAAWRAARRGKVSATDVAKASTKAGFAEVLSDRRQLEMTFTDNGYMKFGRDHEGWIAMELKRQRKVLHNYWLIASANNPLHVATPDALSVDHREIGEIKTGGTEPNVPSMQHVRQMQWQMYCTDAERCHFAFLLRGTVNEKYVPGWFEPKIWPAVERDDKMIAQLIETADRLLEADKETR